MSDINPGVWLQGTFPALGYPGFIGQTLAGVIPITAASGNQANVNAVATLAASGSKFTYILGCVALGAGSTAGLAVNGTIAGVVTGTLTFTYTAPVGVLVPGPAVIMNFGPYGIPSSAVNTAIVCTLPALGAGNTNASIFAWGYQL